ncbi:MAG: PQQ-binding-like beta-propeller repeat protein [Rhodothermales bacterium]
MMRVNPYRSTLPLWTVAALIFLAGCADNSSPYASWSMYEGDAGAAHFSSLTQIDRSNVKDLDVAWTYPAGDNGPSGFSPLVVDRMMYVVADSGALVALDAGTGKELWVHSFPRAGRGVRDRGLLYWESANRSDRRLFVPRGNLLYAINAENGEGIPSFGPDGAIDVREGISRDPEKIRATPSSPGIVFENLVILGSGPGEGYGSGPGDIRAWDTRTGKLAWVFHTIPHPGEYGYDTWENPESWKTAGGANVWGGMSVDVERGILYLPLGSATYDFYGADRLGANLFANSLVALNARTGERIWHYQTVHHDLWDLDLTAAPVLLTVTHEGKETDIVVEAGKTGYVYVFDRVTGEPLWPIEERPVPPSDMPGEEAWPTQPYPTWPEPFGVLSFTEDDVNPYIPQEEQDSLRRYVASMNNLGLFTPPSTTPTMQMPGNSGGANWGTTAADPENGIFYILNKNFPTVLTLEREIPGVPGPDAFPPERGAFVYRQNCQLCHMANLEGQPPLIPSLVNVMDRLKPEEVRQQVREGKGTMPAFRDLTDQEVSSLISYLSFPEFAPPPPPPATSTGPEEGPVRYKTGYGYFLASIGYAIKPPWETLTAYDMHTGNKIWERPVGDVEALVERGITNTGSVGMRGGPSVTAGGLLFVATDKTFRALDKDTGEEIWTHRLPGPVQGIPAIYEVDGRQFVVIGAGPAGGSMLSALTGAPANPLPRNYYAFALTE